MTRTVGVGELGWGRTDWAIACVLIACSACTGLRSKMEEEPATTTDAGVDAQAPSKPGDEDGGKPPKTTTLDGGDGRSDAGENDAASASDAGDGAPPPGETLLESCDEEGAQRCGDSAGSRQACIDGSWTQTDPCPDDAVCTISESGALGVCRTVAEICKGSAGEALCDGQGVMYSCSDDGVLEATVSCASARHCRLGLHRGSCAACVPGTLDEFRCVDAALEQCSHEGDGYSGVMTCDSAELCNAAAGACTDLACSEGQVVCDQDVLLRCNDDQSAFEQLDACGEGLCDGLADSCDVCVAGIDSCDDDTAVHCNTDGTELERVVCEGDTPVCVGNGRCVECAASADCPDPGACKTRYCHLATGTCRPQDAAARSECDGGVCDGEGACVACLDPELDCPLVGPCQERACNDQGMCEPIDVARGDGCPGGYCDGGGECVACVEDGQCPNVGACQVKHCDTGSGTCDPQPAEEGISCSSSGFCNDSGQCVGCAADDHCPDPGECHVRDCDNGVCDPQPVADGESCSGQFGAGVCSGGDCVECSWDGDCDEGVCEDNRCVACRQASDCGSSPNACQQYQCSDHQCSLVARSGSCTLNGGGAGVCSGTTCVECRPNFVATDCGVSPNPCWSYACSGGVCTQSDNDDTTCTIFTLPGICHSGECEPACGDGIVQSSLGEECDYARTNDYHCDDDCKVRRTGDNYVVSPTTWEPCSDQNDCEQFYEMCYSPSTGSAQTACTPTYWNTDTGQFLPNTNCPAVMPSQFSSDTSNLVPWCLINCSSNAQCPSNTTCQTFGGLHICWP